MNLSVVIPTHNELKLNYLPRILRLYSEFPSVELIIVDYQSIDGTRELANSSNVRFLTSASNSRGARINQGLRAASGELILINHPRSLIPSEGIIELLNLPKDHPETQWGGFRHSFDFDHPLLRFTSWYSNSIRPRWSQVVYLDHCIYFYRRLIENDPIPVPEVDIFEDTELCMKLKARANSRPRLLKTVIQTSAVRFQTRGIWRHAVLNQLLKVGHHLGLSDPWMNQIYEGKIGLNSIYSYRRKDPMP